MNIYNNRFYRRIFITIRNDMTKTIEEMGGSVTNEMKLEERASREAKFNFWFTWVMVGLFVIIIHGIIKTILIKLC